MPRLIKSKSTGFTLVELIVVIAILAILSAVFIPSLTRFIDDSRFSNDTAKAASMTRVLEGHFVGSDISDYDAYDIKLILDDYQGESIDYTPEAANTGFFYLPASKRVVALKYEDAESYVDARALFSKQQTTALLSGVSKVETLESEISSPEELFGSGKRLMTRDGSAVAEAISLVYQLASSGSLMDAIHTAGYNTIDTYADSIFARFASLAISTELKEHVLDMLNSYDPETTLYVNNVEWRTLAGAENEVTKIVFAEGISNIPAYTLDDVTLADGLDEITLPRTVKTVEAGAFPAVIESILLKNNAEISLIGEDASLSERFGPATSLMEIAPELNLITYSEGESLFALDLQPLLDYLESLNIVVTAYRVDINFTSKASSRIHVYTKDGYYGYVIPKPA